MTVTEKEPIRNSMKETINSTPNSGETTPPKPNKSVSALLWGLAFLLTVTIAVYQRLTGPTHPVKAQETLKGATIDYKLLRSYTALEDLPVSITTKNENLKAFLNYKRYKTSDSWTEVAMARDGETLSAHIPGQPVAGKIEYMIRLKINGENALVNKGASVVARFKGKVPTVPLIIHIIFMFFSILFALRTGLETLRKNGNYYWMVNWTLGLVFFGGMIMGPIVQKYAFGDLWTGFPFGTDLTDNKVLIALIFWILAFVFKKKSKWTVILATVMMLVIYLIPHSAMGSELDYKTGKMKNKFGCIINTQYIC